MYAESLRTESHSDKRRRVAFNMYADSQTTGTGGRLRANSLANIFKPREFKYQLKAKVQADSGQYYKTISTLVIAIWLADLAALLMAVTKPLKTQGKSFSSQ